MSHEITVRENARNFKLLDDELGMPRPFADEWTIVDLRFGRSGEFKLDLFLQRWDEQLCLVFQNIVSFRAHDQNEILKHWAQREIEQVDIGTIYEIGESVHLEEFATSFAAMINPNINHYLVAGYHLCAEILSTSRPKLLMLRCDGPNDKIST